MANLSDVINPKLILLDVRVNTRDEIVNLLADLMNQEGVLESKEAYLQSVREREALIPTYMGQGIAIPHGICSAVRRPLACFARTEPFLWNEEEESITRFVFLLAVPNVENGRSQHLSLLSDIAILCLDENAKAEWENASTPEEVLASIEHGILANS